MTVRNKFATKNHYKKKGHGRNTREREIYKAKGATVAGRVSQTGA